MSDKFGVIQEQGYPVGQFGFKPLNEADQKRLEEEDKKKKSEDKEEKE